jgi:4-hydroxybenzoate polyprenyltransferase
MSSLDRALGGHKPLAATLNGWLTLARISNSPTVASDALAGAALAGVIEPTGTVALIVVAMVLFYTAGMLLNDICDYAWDVIHRPDRPLVVGLVARKTALAAVLGLFGAGSLLLGLVSPTAVVSGLVLIGAIVGYDAWHKSNPLSPLVMAACRALVYVTAFVAFAWPLTTRAWIAAALLAAYLIGLTAIAKSERRPTVVGYWPAALLFLPLVYFAFQVPPAGLVLIVALGAWVVYSTRFVYRVDGRNIGTAIGHLIAGISLLDALVLAASGALVGVALALAAFGLTLFFQRYIEGT